MTIYNLYMNNYDLITIIDHVSNEIVWRGAFFKLPQEYKLNHLFSYEICIEYNYRHAYVLI